MLAIVVENFKCTDILVFSIGNVTTFPTSWKCKNFNFWHLHSPGRNGISPEVFNEFSKTFFSLKEEKGDYCHWKFQVHRHFRFPIGNVTTFPTSQKCKNFNFSLYTVLAEMLYLQKYLTNFQKLFFRWKKRKLAIVVENFKCTDILVFQ